MPLVEVGMMHIQRGKTALDAETPDGRVLRDAWEGVVAAPGGPGRVAWGLEERERGGEEEKEEEEEEEEEEEGEARRVWAWFEWDSIEQHEEFARSYGAEATRRFGEVFVPGFAKHARLSTAPLCCPATQILLVFFPPQVSQQARDAVAVRSQRLLEDFRGRCDAVRSVGWGWGLETDFPVRGRGRVGEGEGETGAVFFALVGWDEMDGGGREEVRETVALGFEMERCVAWDEFWLRCEVLERC